MDREAQCNRIYEVPTRHEQGLVVLDYVFVKK